MRHSGAWAGECSATWRRDALAGLALWAAFAAMAVLLRGVRWDYTWEYAQTLSGAAPYPAGHPYLRFLRAAPSLQNYLAVAVYWLAPHPAVLNGLTNFVFLLATVWPPFLLAAVTVRRVVWAHAAVVFVLLGIHLSFDPSYPQFIWPNEMSTGHIPTGYALILLAMLVVRRWRLAFFMLGLMPCVHVAQMPILLALLPVFLLWAHRLGEDRNLAKAVPFGFAGLLVTAGVFAVRAKLALPPPAAGPYASSLDPYTVWRHYTFYHDAHRGFPLTGNSHIALAATAVFGAGAALWEWRECRRFGAMFWLWLYAAVTAGLVWGISATHAALGSATPALLIVWLPYRMAIHVPPIAVALIVGVLAAGRAPCGPAILGAALLYGAANPLLELLVGRNAYYHYFIFSETVFYGLLGAATAVLAGNLRPFPAHRNAWLTVCGGAMLVLAYFHHFAPLCIMLGAAAAWGIGCSGRLSRLAVAAGQTPVVAALIAVNLGCLLHTEHSARQHLPVSPFLDDVARVLDARREPKALVVGPPDQLLLQAKTGHPFLAHMGIPEWISYMPAIGPSTAQLYHDVYGIDFGPGSEGFAGPWQNYWKNLSEKDWQALGQRYGFHYVLAPSGLHLALHAVVASEEGMLYEIPPDAVK